MLAAGVAVTFAAIAAVMLAAGVAVMFAAIAAVMFAAGAAVMFAAIVAVMFAAGAAVIFAAIVAVMLAAGAAVTFAAGALTAVVASLTGAAVVLVSATVAATVVADGDGLVHPAARTRLMMKTAIASAIPKFRFRLETFFDDREISLILAHLWSKITVSIVSIESLDLRAVKV